MDSKGNPVVLRLTKNKLHPKAWYKARNRRGPGKALRKIRKQRRLQRLMRFTWAFRKILASNVLWRRLAMRPGLDRQIP